MLREMYFGKVIPWERKNRKCVEQAELVKKIEDEERYFVQKMSLDDCERFQKLSNMYSQLAMSEEGKSSHTTLRWAQCRRWIASAVFCLAGASQNVTPFCIHEKKDDYLNNNMTTEQTFTTMAAGMAARPRRNIWTIT